MGHNVWHLCHFFLFFTCAPSLRASNGGVHVEREWGGGALLDALHEESLPPALGQDPVGRRRGRRHQDHSDEAACEGDHLRNAKGETGEQL